MPRYRELLLALAIAAGTHNATAGVDTSPFPELIANPFEARIGSMYQFDDARLRLDIGASIDLVDSLTPLTDSRLSIGIDFMTWTRLRSAGNFKFPVETIDYWFGVNGKLRFSEQWQIRARLAHISSHMVDGLADTSGTILPQPFVYSREFIEVILARDIDWLRPYIGVTAVWTKQPSDPDPIIPQAGFDVRLPITETWQLRGGYDIRMVGINGTYAAANALQLGMMHQNNNGTGWSVNLYGYSGRSMHGMFYTSTDGYLALGFQFLW